MNKFSLICFLLFTALTQCLNRACIVWEADRIVFNEVDVVQAIDFLGLSSFVVFNSISGMYTDDVVLKEAPST